MPVRIGKGGKHKAEEARPNEVTDDSRPTREPQEYAEAQELDRPPPEKVTAALAIVVNDVDYEHVDRCRPRRSRAGTPPMRLAGEFSTTGVQRGRVEWRTASSRPTTRPYARVRWDSFRPTRTNIGALFNRASKISPGWWRARTEQAEEETQAETNSRAFPIFRRTGATSRKFRSGDGCTGSTTSAALPPPASPPAVSANRPSPSSMASAWPAASRCSASRSMNK